MSPYYDRFNRNIERVDNLCRIFELSKQSNIGRSSVKEGDTLRAAVVFLHAALEDYLRGILIEYIPYRGSSKTLEKISLCGNEDNRPEKFYLSALMPFRQLTIDQLIEKSVQQHMSKVSFNNMTDIVSWLDKIGVKIDSFSKKDSVDTMIKRRHKIVHETDANSKSGSGYHYAASINKQTVEAWEASVVLLVDEIEGALDQ